MQYPSPKNEIEHIVAVHHMKLSFGISLGE